MTPNGLMSDPGAQNGTILHNQKINQTIDMGGNVPISYDQNDQRFNQKMTGTSVVQKRGGSPNNLIMNGDYGNNFGPVEPNSGLSGVQLMNKNQRERGNTTNFFQTKGATIYNKVQPMNNTTYGTGFGV